MGYLVLARKYRPQAFADMTGQEHVVQTLSNALRSGRVAHALLFCGPRGCGKTTTARIVAKALNCEKGPTPEPCGVCTPCREITAGTDVDVQEIDAASNTGVDNVRELRESAKYLPARDRFKIFIVDEVHMLSKAAFNAFLKTLEEPPGHVKFLFATTDPQALPDTILSRCQRHNFRLVPLKQISERIRAIAHAEQVTIDDGAVALVARQAAGSMRDSLSILDQLFSSVGPGVAITEPMAAQALGALDRSVVSDLASALLARDPRGVLTGISRAYDGGHDLKRLAEDLASHVRNLLASSVAGAPLDLPDHELRALREQAAAADPAELARLFDIVHAALFDIARANQPRHALEIALLKAVYLAPSSSVQSLLGRADELARRLGIETPPPGGGGRGGGGGSGGGVSRTRPSFEGSGAAPSARAEWSPSAVSSTPMTGRQDAPVAAPAAQPAAASVAPPAWAPASTNPAPTPSTAHAAVGPSGPGAGLSAPATAAHGVVPQSTPGGAATQTAAAAAPARSAPAFATAPAPIPTAPAVASSAAAADPVAAPHRPAALAPAAPAHNPETPALTRQPPTGAPVQKPAAESAGGGSARAAGPERKPWERHLSLVPGAASGDEVPVETGAGPGVPEPSAPVRVAPSGAPPASDLVRAAPIPPAPPPSAHSESNERTGLAAQTRGGASAELLERWSGLVEGVRARRRALASLLEHARPLMMQGGELSLGFAKGDFHAEGLLSERFAIEALLGEITGTKVSLRIVELSAEQSAQVASLAESVDRAEREARDARLKEGREHPAILLAASVLGADIEDVRDLGGVSA